MQKKKEASLRGCSRPRGAGQPDRAADRELPPAPTRSWTAHARGRRRAARAAPLPPAAASRLRRRGGRPRHLVPNHGGAGQARCQHGLVRRPDQRLCRDGSLRRSCGRARDLERAALGAELGTAREGARRRGRRRPQADVGSGRCRAAAGTPTGSASRPRCSTGRGAHPAGRRRPCASSWCRPSRSNGSRTGT